MSRLDIAVIGGSGFIGTRLVELLLKAGHRARIIDKVESQTYPRLWKYGDVRNLDQMKEGCRGCSVIYNLAAEHEDDVRLVSLYDEVNVDGARTVCKAAGKLGIERLIFTSSVAIYGFSEAEMHEQTEPRPVNDYGRTKLEAEQVYLDWSDADEARQLTIVRPTVIFGERNRGNVYKLIRQIAKRYFVMVGDGQNRKSIAYVGNIAAFLEYLLRCPNPVGVFNYVDKPDLQMSQLVRLVRETLGFRSKLGLKLSVPVANSAAALLDSVAGLTGSSFPISRVRIQKFCANTQFSNERVLQTGFRPGYELVDALQQTIRSEFCNTLEAGSEPSTARRSEIN